MTISCCPIRTGEGRLFSQTRHKQKGFIITLEAVLITSILGIGLLVGVVALRDALIKYWHANRNSDFVVVDSSTPPVIIGSAIGFDEHEAPQVPFFDYDVGFDVDGDGAIDNPGEIRNYRVLIGVRDDRFTSRQPLFYATSNCTLNAGEAPCIAGAGDEGAYSTGIDDISGSGGVSYAFALQNGPTYAIGAGGGIGQQGRLYRQASRNACGLGAIGSMWDSQRVVEGEPCIDLTAPGTPAAPVPASLHVAVEVVDGSGTNVLDNLTPPFYTNMVSNPKTTWTSVSPAKTTP